jgi:hypothetical protein
MRNILLTLFAIVLLGANAWIVYPKYQNYSEEGKFIATAEVSARADQTEKIVMDGINSGKITYANFRMENTASSAPVFSSFFEDTEGVSVLRMKFWDNDYHVVWSDTPALIGQRFADNHELKEVYEDQERAIEGKLNQTSAVSQKNETASEGSYNNFLEVYVPVVDQGRVVGVAEVYVAAQDIMSTYRTAFYQSLILNLAGSLLLFGLALFLFRSKMRNT